MLFSIIVPIYNSEKYLRDCLNSLIKQNIGDYEIVLIDDGSTDKSGAICDEYSVAFEFIKTFHKQNQGQFLARIDGINKSSGDYILFVDSDDMIRSDTLIHLKRVADKTKADIIIFDGTSNADFTGTWFNFPFVNMQVYGSDSKKIIYEQIIAGHSLNAVHMKAFKRGLFVDAPWDYDLISSIRNGEDFLQVIPLYIRAKTIVYDKETLYFYRINQDSVTHKYSPNYYFSRIAIHEYLLECNDLWDCLSDYTKYERLLYRRTFSDIVDVFVNIKYDAEKNWSADILNISNDPWFRIHYPLVKKIGVSTKKRIVLWLLYHKNLFLLRLIFWLKVI